MAKVRRIGHDFERFIANMMRAIVPAAKRCLQYQEGEHAPDVLAGPFYQECKKRKNQSMPAWSKKTHTKCAQFAQQTNQYYLPMVVSRKPRQPIFVTMQVEVFMEMARVYHQHWVSEGLSHNLCPERKGKKQCRKSKKKSKKT